MSDLRKLTVIIILVVFLQIFNCANGKHKHHKLHNGHNLAKSKETVGLLYPQASETRELISLDGIWGFLISKMSDPDEGIREQWYKYPLNKFGTIIPMPVPASYNDITTMKELRDHVGSVWYQRTFFVPTSWSRRKQHVWLRFGSVHYTAIVWVNGDLVMMHTIGHLPFEAEITKNVRFGMENFVTVLVDNTLTNITIPQGEVKKQSTDNGNTTVQHYTFDFFNYAGIHRSVHLYTTPHIYVRDIKLTTDVNEKNVGIIHYQCTYDMTSATVSDDKIYFRVQLLNHKNEIVVKNTSFTDEGYINITNANLWWPYLMHPEPGYLYTLVFGIMKENGQLIDIYRLPVGIRKLQWDNGTLSINNRPVYLHGFGRHEDSDIRGKGLDYALMTRDFNLLKWIGANAYRTSHYPYSEESMLFADMHGIMIIDECSGVNIDQFSDVLLENHKSALEQLIHRDRNHASVIAWSVANEARSNHKNASEYFGNLTEYTRKLDLTRPLTAAINVLVNEDQLAKYLDIIGFNHYSAWYYDPGHLDMITKNVIDIATEWNKKYKRPVIMFEYGADTMEGLHFLPNYIWSEDYQYELLANHFKAFDELRKMKWFIGEFLWNFADFKTDQSTTRVGGNKKGIFTRNRQPKSAAYLLRQRYYGLAAQLHQCPVPDDLFPYIVDWQSPSVITDEL